MRPGQIQVFDGLRVTTEHLEHFQGSLHSAIQDIREILGVGRVHAGFEVITGEGDTVTVQPGIAFDFEKNRIVSDEPKSVQVMFAADQDAAFVCAKYDQIEEGQVEGRSTLIWDETAVEVRATAPTERENLVTLAKVVRAGDGSLKVVAREAAPAAEAVAAPASTKLLNVKQGVLRLPADPAAGAHTSITLAQKLRTALAARSAEANAASSASVADRLVVPLASADLSLGFAMTSLTVYTILSASVEATAAPPPADKSAVSATANTLPASTASTSGTAANAETANRATANTTAPSSATASTGASNTATGSAPTAGAPTASTATTSTTPAARTSVNVRSSATGEVSCNAQGLSQFGMSTWPNVTQLAQENIAHLPLAAAIASDAAADTELHGAVVDLLKALQLTIRVVSADDTGVKIVCALECTGANEYLLRTLEEHGPRLTWDSWLAWKALGDSNPIPPNMTK